MNSPSSIAFLGPDHILVLEKYKGRVHRILEGKLLEEPLLDVAVSNKFERGMLGIGLPKNENEGRPTYIFLYYTESSTREDGSDVCPESHYSDPGNEPLGNRLYRYDLVNNSKLTNPKLLLDLPATPGPTHNGGKVAISPDGNVYVTIGDVLGYRNKSSSNKAVNFENGTPDGRSGILRITQNGSAVDSGIIGKGHPLNKYYAYGIRDSFGIAFDPLTGNLWDTENGDAVGDEINLVEPGFNSGWNKIQGIWLADNVDASSPSHDSIVTDSDIEDLEDFDGRGKYSKPEFTWRQTLGPTALTFLTSEKLGDEYENDLFVGDVQFGNVYRFELNKDRTELVFPEGPLRDRVADADEELLKDHKGMNLVFREGFGVISDLGVGDDGYLYVASYEEGAIYRIVPAED